MNKLYGERVHREETCTNLRGNSKLCEVPNPHLSRMVGSYDPSPLSLRRSLC